MKDRQIICLSDILPTQGVNNTLAVNLFDFIQLMMGSIFRMNENDAYIVARAFQIDEN